ncbi:aminotransferase class I/II-fold pyridoxal phosphate-dependent enzyme [Rhodocytophaga aerolata]|uniref:Aminotransferase n=1 Tax=Rhodocytophaga aerolata TaxID=455078 RepID=A0ABT8R2S3_9BACT|nr:aminotransferase class I/II-fold pyridoxal phosphate-dependent enzyme [Rhodocytophaga aerolata]MDO1446405.1 aminotransferase class I/II-fold pyridoxal phosphate-dependent enzyme [Rhodocytophaga aerolata]
MIIQTAKRLGQVQEYYFSVKLQEVRKLQESGKDVINLGVGSPDLFPSDETVQALIHSASQKGNHGYQPYKGIAPFRKAISSWYSQTYGVTLNPDTEVLPLIGSKEGITHISLAFLDEGDEVLIPELGYPTYKSVSDMVGAKAIPYPLVEANNYEPDWDFLEKGDWRKVKLMWVNYPHMPTGAPANQQLFEKLVAFGKSKKVLICHDNPYSLVLNEEKPLSLLSVEGSKEVCLEMNSMSKSFNMAGWRIGWVSGAREYLDAIIKIKTNIDSGMFLPIQEAAIAALQNSAQWHAERNAIYRNRKQLVYQILNLLNCTYRTDQQGMFVWAKVPSQIQSVEKFVDYLLNEHYVFITPGFIFGEKGNRFIRLSLCTTEERLQQVIDRLKNIHIPSL